MFLNTDSKYIWLNGRFQSFNDTNIHLLSHTLHYGLGVFEGVRAYETKKGPAIFRLNEHTDRLFNSAHIMNMKMPFSKSQVIDAQKKSVSKNNLKGYNVNFLNKLPAVIPKNSLLISTWALSEIPLEERTVIQEDFKGGIITYQQQIFGVDNAKYFKDWKGYRLNMPWVPWDGGSYFLSW